jgi:hypothetical protein
MRDGVGAAELPAVLESLFAMIGDTTPASDVAPAALRLWWSERRPGLDGTLWGARPASPGMMIPALTDAALGTLARNRLELMTGIDFVDVAAPHAIGDSHDVANALAWWATHERAWKRGALYRSGRVIATQDLVDALR